MWGMTPSGIEYLQSKTGTYQSSSMGGVSATGLYSHIRDHPIKP